ncbi:MAG: hypothetical protein J6S14_22910 [Clostridia bacterium]|nr:hypothetical protein [Clostridia bacterium]
MFAVSVGETRKIRVISEDDVAALVSTLLSLGCRDRVTYKPITDADADPEGTENGEDGKVKKP